MASDQGAVWLHARARLRLVELSDACGLTQEVLRDLVELGVLEPADAAAMEFGADCLPTLRAAARLRADFELETHALALVVSYMRRIAELEAQLRLMRAETGFPPARE